MDLDDFRTILETAGVDVWTFIDTAVLVASLDYGQELKQRRDRIVERLYGTSMVTRCRNCDYGEKINGNEVKVEAKRENGRKGDGSPSTPPSVDRNDDEEDGVDPYGGLFDDEQKRVLDIKERLEDHNQSEDSLVQLLQSLADMDITFQALQETDIGRHVNRLRKHSSNEVRRLVKQVIRKWKDIVDEWVMVNQTAEPVSSLAADGDSPQQKFSQSGHHQQVPDFGCSPNLNNGSSPGSEKNNSEPEKKPKPIPPPRKEPPAAAKASHSSQPSQNVQRQQKESFDLERLASASKRLQDNYKEAENAKKQRTIRVMDIHELPKPKKTFFPKGKGGAASHGRHW